MINHTLKSTTTVNNFHLNFYTFSDNKCMSTYSTFQYYDSNYLNIPSQIYPLQLNAGDKIMATCSWPG